MLPSCDVSRGQRPGSATFYQGLIVQSDTDQSDLKNLGLKATFPRLKILDVFRKSGLRHLSAEDVYRSLIAEKVDIGLATVYRVLTQFEQAGILARSQFDGGKAVFELNDGDHHDHLICTHCGKVVEFSDADIEKRQHRVARENGFTLDSHAMVLYGVCSACTG
ncbi:MAG: ferric iron uptake transcriptional regulator [Burkholderiaceae bacterium]|nr:ferric iron uptake transcriptional regulator [Burkholderiaceae bacterium]